MELLDASILNDGGENSVRKVRAKQHKNDSYLEKRQGSMSNFAGIRIVSLRVVIKDQIF